VIAVSILDLNTVIQAAFVVSFLTQLVIFAVFESNAHFLTNSYTVCTLDCTTPGLAIIFIFFAIVYLVPFGVKE